MPARGRVGEAVPVPNLRRRDAGRGRPGPRPHRPDARPWARRDLCTWLPWAQRFPQRGYQALAFDFEGFGGSRRGSGPDARIDTDVAAAVEQLGRRGADRIVLIGSSMGATATLVVVRHGHGASMLAYHDQGPRVLATVHRFVAEQTGR